jgi:hypothetical protein
MRAVVELVPGIAERSTTGQARVLAMVRHFTQHRSFYRAMLTGPCAYGLNKALSGLLSPFNQQLVRRMYRTAPDEVEDLTAFVTGGWAAVINAWVVEWPEPLDVETFTDRLMRMLSVLTDDEERGQ